jgi:putative zinc finger protein
MDCREYINNYLAADADNELTAAQQRLVHDHLGGCAACRGRLVDERTLKALLRQHAGIVKTPADLRLRIRAALGEMSDSNFIAECAATSDRRSNRLRGMAHRVRRNWNAARPVRQRLWIPVAIASPIVLFFLIFGGRLRSGGNIPPNPAFDLAISRYESFVRGFHPNMPIEEYDNHSGSDYAWVMSRDPVHRAAEEIADLGRSYREMEMPGDLYDFDAVGYAFAGGRFDHLVDGRPVTYTLYRGNGGMILSICFKDPRIVTPVTMPYWVGLHSFCRYRGYTLCTTIYPTGHFASIVVSRMPIVELIRAVALSDIATSDQ